MNVADRFQKQRIKMVDGQIRARGIMDLRVLAAMEKIPRHLFVDEVLADRPITTILFDRPPADHFKPISWL